MVHWHKIPACNERDNEYERLLFELKIDLFVIHDALYAQNKSKCHSIFYIYFNSLVVV